MAVETLVDCFNASIGATSIARPTTFDRMITQEEIVSASDAVSGDYSIDDGPYDIRASLAAQDPLVVPTVAALSFPAAVEATGRLKGTSTYRTHGIARGVLTGIQMDLVDRQAGSCRFDFINSADSASDTLDDEAPTTTGSAPSLVSRATTIRILSATFTPTGGVASPIYGITRVTWNAAAIVNANLVSPGSNFVDAVDVAGWRITGRIELLDTSLSESLSAAEALAASVRGTLAVSCRVSGQAEAASPPADVTVTMNLLKFRNPRESLATKADGTVSLDFNAILRADTTLKTIGEMISAA